MRDDKYSINAVKGFLSCHSDNEEFRIYLLNAFSACKAKGLNRYKLYWTDKYTGYRVDFLFANNNDEKTFWINNMKNYSYLYVYASLLKWSEEYNDELTLKKRLNEFQNYYSERIDKDIELFKKDYYIVPHTILEQIGFFIDTYKWYYHWEKPFFLTILNKTSTLPLYNQYKKEFANKIYTAEIQEIDCHIVHILSYCEVADLIEGKSNCFVTLVKFLSGQNEDADVSELLRLIPYKRCDLNTYKNILLYWGIYIGTFDSSFHFCNSDEDVAFWKANISQRLYIEFFCCLVLWCWHDYLPQCPELRKWEESVLLEFPVEEEMDKWKNRFVYSRQIIPDLIFDAMAMVFDSYMWEKYHILPSLFPLTFHPKSMISEYRIILLDSLHKDKELFYHKTNLCLQFCLMLDSMENVKPILGDVIRVIQNNKLENLETQILAIPYYSDDFNMSILDYCDKNRDIYMIHSDVIEKYETNISIESWRVEIHEKLKDNHQLPYDQYLCEATESHSKIKRLLDSRHSIFWDKCNQASIETLNEVKEIDLFNKRKAVRDKVYNKIVSLIMDEKRELSIISKPLVLLAIKEAISEFILQTENEAVKRGKKIRMKGNVLKIIYDDLSNLTENITLPDISLNTYLYSISRYSEKVRDVWVDDNLFSKDRIKNENEIRPDWLKEIRDSFERDIWSHLVYEFEKWCNECYGEEKSSYDYSSGSSEDGYDYTFDPMYTGGY